MSASKIVTRDEIAPAIRAERIRLGITLRESAALAGIEFQNWCAIENGNRTASVEMLTQMGAAVGLEITPQFQISRLSRRKNSKKVSAST